MDILDLRTLLFVITLALVCRAAILAYVWRIHRQYRPVRYWAGGSILLACGVVLVGVRDIAPPLVSILLAQTLILFGWLLVSGGIVIAAERTPPWRAGLLLAGAAACGVGWFLYATPSFGARTVAVTVPAVAFDAWAALACLRAPASTRRTTLRLLGGVLAIEAVSNIWKMVVILRTDIATMAGSGPATVPFYVMALAAVIVGTVLFVLLAAQTLQEELDREIGERKAREQTLRLAALVFQHSSEGMMVTDPGGVIINVNPAFTALTGFTPEDALGRTPRILKSGRQDPAFYQSLWNDVLTKGTWQGEVWNRHKCGTIFAERLTVNAIRRADGTTESFVALFHDITAQKQSAEVIYRQAHFDALTALPNRFFFFDQLSKELSRARRSGGRVGILFMDLNQFKPVNDRYGHEAGDRVLKTVAERWSAALRSNDTLARLGGDEFALIVSDLGEPAELALIADKLINALSAPIELGRATACTVGTSVGGSLYPDNATEMDSLIAAADAAMYASKANGGGRYTPSDTLAAAVERRDNWVVLDDACITGIATIDEQHLELVRMANQANRAMKEGQAEQPLRDQLMALIAYTRMHFDTESAYMRDYGYPDREAHDRLHQDLLAQVEQWLERFAAGDELKLLQAIKDWLIMHIQQADKPLGAFLIARGAR